MVFFLLRHGLPVSRETFSRHRSAFQTVAFNGRGFSFTVNSAGCVPWVRRARGRVRRGRRAGGAAARRRHAESHRRGFPCPWVAGVGQWPRGRKPGAAVMLARAPGRREGGGLTV